MRVRGRLGLGMGKEGKDWSKLGLRVVLWGDLVSAEGVRGIVELRLWVAGFEKACWVVRVNSGEG